MKYNLSINQKAVVDAGIKGVDAIDMLLFDVLSDAISHGGLDTECMDGRLWTWVAYSLMQEELPLLDLSTQTFYRRLIKLCDAGLIEKSDRNQDARKVFIAFGPKARLLTSDRSYPYKNEWGGPYKNEGGVPTNLEGYNNTINHSTNKSKEKEAHAQENEKSSQDDIENSKSELPPTIEQPQSKNENRTAKKRTTLDIPFCEGHGVKIARQEYPQQAAGIPFMHPDLISVENKNHWFEMWWKLYGVEQGRGKVEMLFMQHDMADIANFKKMYLHTFLMAALTEKEFRPKPQTYFRERQWFDEIIDRRTKKKADDITDLEATRQKRFDEMKRNIIEKWIFDHPGEELPKHMNE